MNTDEINSFSINSFVNDGIVDWEKLGEYLNSSYNHFQMKSLSEEILLFTLNKFLIGKDEHGDWYAEKDEDVRLFRSPNTINDRCKALEKTIKYVLKASWEATKPSQFPFQC